MKMLTMVALEAFLRAVATPFVRFYNEFSEKIEDLRNQLTETLQQMKNLQAKVDGEKRKMSEEELDQFTALSDQFDALKEEIERREDLEAKEQILSTGRGRKTEPEPGPSNAAQQYGSGTGAPGGSRRPTRTRPMVEVDNRWGWNSFGDFAIGVFQAAMGNLDPRLIMNQPTHVSTEGVGADGGFAVPPEFRTQVQAMLSGEDSLLARTDQWQSNSNLLIVPTDETTPHGSSGLQAYWESEASQITQSKIALKQSLNRLYKLTALVPASDELLEDSAAMSTYIRRKAPEKIVSRVNEGIIEGTGAGSMLGILNSPHKVTVSAEGGQSADTVIFENIVKMYNRLHPAFRARAAWFINADVEPQLLQMAFPTSGTAVPVYLPAGGLSASPFATLMGKPVIPTEHCPELGAEGDIIIADLSQYWSVLKTGGMRQDVSMHLFFDRDLTAFRFILRIGGQPWWSAPISPKHGSTTRSSIVTLEAR